MRIAFLSDDDQARSPASPGDPLSICGIPAAVARQGVTAKCYAMARIPGKWAWAT